MSAASVRFVKLAWRQARRARTAWNRFWFRTDGRAQVRLFRLVFGLLMLVFYATRGLDLIFYFGEDGILPRAVVQDLLPRPGSFSIFNHFYGHGALWLGQAAFLVSLGFLAFGILPRLAALTALAMHLSFLHRNIAVAYGVDFITTFYLLYMVMADHRAPEKSRPWDFAAALGSMAYRLCQLQVCIIYGYSGLHKLRGVRWWQGEAIWDVVANHQITRFDLTWLSAFPIVLVIANYATLIFEIYFPVVIWNKPLRNAVLLFGIALHIGIALAINITVFSALMITTYIFFLEKDRVNALYHAVNRVLADLARKSKVPTRSADQSLV